VCAFNEKKDLLIEGELPKKRAPLYAELSRPPLLQASKDLFLVAVLFVFYPEYLE
jgi:hypothetical protein